MCETVNVFLLKYALTRWQCIMDHASFNPVRQLFLSLSTAVRMEMESSFGRDFHEHATEDGPHSRKTLH